MDSTSEDGASGISIDFFRDPSTLNTSAQSILRFTVSGVWADGTTFSSVLFAENSVVEECEHFTTGNWFGDGLEAVFTVSKDNSEINISVKSKDVEGQFSISSFSNPAYANGLTYPDQEGNSFYSPLLYLTTPMPAGHAKANMRLGSKQLSFEGMGGEDRNWGAFWLDTVGDHWWYLRSAIGPYTLYFHKFISGIDEETYTHAYLERDGSPIFRSFTKGDTCSGECANLTLRYDGKVRGNFSDKNTGFRIDISSEMRKEQWTFYIDHVHIEHEEGHEANVEYDHFVNTARGGARGEEEYKGVAKSEQVRFMAIKPIPPTA